MSSNVLCSTLYSFVVNKYIKKHFSVEHLGLTLALNVPVFVVVTKIDICPPNVLDETLELLQRILKSPGCRKMPLLVTNVDDVIVTAANFISDR